MLSSLLQEERPKSQQLLELKCKLGWCVQFRIEDIPLMKGGNNQLEIKSSTNKNTEEKKRKTSTVIYDINKLFLLIYNYI